MAIAVGTEIYRADHLRVIARGRAHSVKQRDDALDGDVRLLVQDDVGVERAKSLTAGLNLTGFQTTNLSSVLNGGSAPKDWEVGEAYGEAYLVEHHQCHFPWSDRWDERKDKSSLPGSDLVGFQETALAKTKSYRFTFGEVKTSSDGKCPPGVMYGREGLKQQMEDLRDRQDIRNTLVRYVMMRAAGADWLDKFKLAMSRFLQDGTDVAVYGILVRDVSPDARDLKTRAEKLGAQHPASMHIELLAIYLPSGSIAFLGTKYSAVTAAPLGSPKIPTKSGPSNNTAPVNKLPVKKAPKKKGGT